MNGSSRDAGSGVVRLLFIIPSLQFGGAERQLVELLRLLQGSPYHSTVAYLSGYLNDARGGFYAEVRSLRNVELVAVRRSNRLDVVGPVLELVRLARSRRSDIICGHLNFGSLLALGVGRLTGRPVIADAIKDCAPDKRLILRLSRWAEARFADYIVSNSRAGFDIRFPRFEPNFRVVPNVIDPSRFSGREAESAAIRRELGLDRFRQLVGMVASLTDFKDHQSFLRMAVHVRQVLPNTGFLVVGDGPRRLELESLAAQLGIADSVVFAGGRRDVDAITPMLDVACLFTNYRIIHEGLPNALLEAMACAKPVVATLGGGTPEAVTDGETGFLVRENAVHETAKVVSWLLADAATAQRIGERARDVVRERYSVSAQLAAYDAMFRNLYQRTGRVFPRDGWLTSAGIGAGQ